MHESLLLRRGANYRSHAIAAALAVVNFALWSMGESKAVDDDGTRALESLLGVFKSFSQELPRHLFWIGRGVLNELVVRGNLGPHLDRGPIG